MQPNIFNRLSDGISAELIRKHIRALQGVRHYLSDPIALKDAELYVREVLASYDYAISDHSFDDDGRSFCNVIATRQGNRFPEQSVLVLAHFDTVSISAGADDNASGVAVMLELARVLAPLEFERTIHFVGVNLEENAGEDGSGAGTRGSSALARYAKEEGWEIEGVVVLESVAFAGPSVIQSAPAGLPFDVPETGDFIAVIGNEHSERLVRLFSRGIEENRIPLPYLSLVVPGNGEVLPDTRRSDHAPFWDNGFRAIMLTDTNNFRNPHYHQPSDTLETLNLSFATEVCRATAALVIDLAVPVVPRPPEA